MGFNTSPQQEVTSSGKCKSAEGGVFPIQVESVEDGVDDTVYGLDADETDHRSGTAADLYNAAFDCVGGA